MESLETREKQYEESIWFVESINKNSDQIVDCLNQWESCQELPEEIKDELWLAKSYLLTKNLKPYQVNLVIYVHIINLFY